MASRIHNEDHALDDMSGLVSLILFCPQNASGTQCPQTVFFVGMELNRWSSI